jgi:hypothetical protein
MYRVKLAAGAPSIMARLTQLRHIPAEVQAATGR